MQLRPYQLDSINSCIFGFKAKRRQLLVLPTGSGKTVIFWYIIKKMGCKVLILLHTRELLEQVFKTGNQLFPGISCCKYRKNKTISHVTISTVQAAISKDSIKHLKENNFDLIIIDECHRGVAESYQKILENLNWRNKYLLGVTATPYRTDGKSIHELFGFQNISISLAEMIQMGHLCDLKGYRIKTNCSLKNVKKFNGDFNSKHLESIINVKNRNSLIVQEYKKISPNEKAIIFCISVKHAYEMKEEFLKNDIICEVLEGKTPKNLRENFIEHFRQGKITVLANCQILTEGFDEPSVTTLLMARPTCSKTLYVQMIGRGTRLFKNKDHCKVIEFTDNEYDICDLSSLIEGNSSAIKIENGESFLKFSKKKKELLHGSSETTVEKINFISSTPSQRKASIWQIKELEKRKITFKKPLTELTANHLLSRS